MSGSGNASRMLRICGGLILTLLSALIVACNQEQPAKSTDPAPITNTPWADNLSETLSKARAGSAEAQNTIGKALATGTGLPKDRNAAHDWFLQAAEQGHKEAQYNLALLLLDNERRTAADVAKARKWLRAAAQADVALAQYRLAELVRTGIGGEADLVQAARLYRQAAQQGHTRSQFNLGLMYQLGEGVPRDLTEAAHWYRLAAEGDLPEAQLKMGNLIQSGSGVEQSDKLAVFWYRKAAMAGYAPAQSNLALMYVAGKGVAPDPVEAYAWWTLAANNGIAQAEKWRQKIAPTLTPAQRKEATQRLNELRQGITNRNLP